MSATRPCCFYGRRVWSRDPAPIKATGPLGFAVNLGGFLALYLTPIYLPQLAVTSDSALIFYGASMWLAAVRGYRGCELLAVSNWVVGRDDQVGCVIFPPLDDLERRLGGPRRIHTGS